MKMSSDLGKMYRRNYMVKSQLRSLTEKSKALNARINNDTKIDEWAESYITRADAQIDDVSDYMNYRNLGNLSKGQGHIINYTVYEHAPTATPPGVSAPSPVRRTPYRDGGVRVAPAKNNLTSQQMNEPQRFTQRGQMSPSGYPTGSREDLEVRLKLRKPASELGNITDSLPQVTVGSTAGALLMLGGMGAVYGLVTYSDYKSQKKLTDSAKERLKRMGIYAGVGAGIGTIYKGIVGTGQATGYY